MDQKAAPGGDGSAAKPFQTIGDAIKVAKDSDTVTVKGGVYREHVAIVKKGTAENPFTFRAAAGETVVVTNFKPITGWQKFRDNIYTTTVDWPARDLYVGYLPQMISRDPPADKPWHQIASIEGENLKVDGDLVAKNAGKDAFLFVFKQSNLTEDFIKVSAVDPAAKTIKIDLGNFYTKRTLSTNNGGLKDRFLICNDLSLVTQPGRWAYETLERGKTKLYFWPGAPGDLDKTQSRPGICQRSTPGGPVVNVERSAYVRVEGLVVNGGGDSQDGGGIRVKNSQYVTIESCISHDNGGLGGAGIFTSRTMDSTIQRCMAIRNRFGIMVDASHRVTVDECEVGYCYDDSYHNTAPLPPWPENKNKPPFPADFSVSDGCGLRRSYLHHCLWLGHPDNIQSWSFRNGTVEDCLLAFGGQGIIVGNFTNLKVTGNVFVGNPASALVVDGRNADKELTVTAEHNTLALSGSLALNYMAGKIIFDDNLVFGHPLGGPGSPDKAHYDWEAHGNLIWTFGKPETNNKLDPKATVADPQLKNVPQATGFIAGKAKNPSTTSHLVFAAYWPRKPELFAVGDNVEVNGDGKLRHITAVEAGAITIDPPLQSTGMHEVGDIIVFDWGKKTDFQLDTRPDPNGPAGKSGVGSSIDIAAYQRGEFEGGGKRLLPPIPPELKAAWPDPSYPILPAWGLEEDQKM